MVTQPSPRESPLNEEENAEVRRVAEQLRVELGQLVNYLPQQYRGGAPMSRELGIDRSTCQRVLQAVRKAGDVSQVLVQVPGIEGLRQFADALQRHGAPQKLLTCAEQAFDAFGALIEHLGGSQAALSRRIQAINRGGADRVSFEAEGALREQAFEAVSVLTGRQIEQQSNFLLIQPLPTDQRRAEIIGARDMQGLSGAAGASPVSGIFFSRAHESLPEGQPRPVPFDRGGHSGANEEGSTTIAEFCSEGIPRVTSRRVGDVTVELIDPPGKDSPPLDVGLAYRFEPPILHPGLQDDRRLNLYYHCVVPTRRVLLYAYLHRSMAGRCLVDAAVHQRSVEALADGPEPWFDRLEQKLVVEVLGSDLSAAGHAASPRQERFLAHLFQEAGWLPSDFIGFRLSLDHPIWGCRYTMGFEFSEGPEAHLEA